MRQIERLDLPEAAIAIRVHTAVWLGYVGDMTGRRGVRGQWAIQPDCCPGILLLVVNSLTIGIARPRIKIGMANLAYNFQRLA